MSVTITFNTVAEKPPMHYEHVIFLRPSSHFGFQGFEPKECVVQYDWMEVDAFGETTGNSACYDPETDSKYNLGDIYEDHKLIITFDGMEATPDTLWINVNDYWKCFDGE